jgi:hypothetical protein
VVAGVLWVRAVSAETATLYGALIAGTFALLGEVIERVLRLTGRLWLTTSSDPTLRVVIGRNVGGDELTFVDLFNGKEVPSGLRDVRLELLVYGDGVPFRSHPSEAVPIHTPTSAVPSREPRPLGVVINLVPRQFRQLELHGAFSEAAAESIRDRRWRKVEFVGEFPRRPLLGILGSKTFRETIVSRPPFPDPWRDKRPSVKAI